MSAPAIVLLTRDLRTLDHPALCAAAAGGRPVLPLFVLDDRVLAAPSTGPNRLAFLLESLGDLRGAFRRLGGELYVRRGDPAAVAVSAARAVGATEVHVSADVTPVARRRRTELARRCAEAGIAHVEHPGLAVVEPGLLRPAGGDHYRVFTPYFRAWSVAPRRPLLGEPGDLTVPGGLEPGTVPSLADLAAGADPVSRRGRAPRQLGEPSPGRDRGGATRARERFDRWIGSGSAAAYATLADDLAVDGTARLSSYLHFGCLSPAWLEDTLLEERASQANEGLDAVVRQLSWRDFYLNVTASFPSIGSADYRARPIAWRRDDEELAAWKEGRTGVPLVDAAMGQLLAEGFVHNRARLVAASYLVKTLRHDWREGAAHYLYWLTDGDIPSNSGNWQWMAGTGNDTRPNRVLNPLRQAARFDPDGVYRSRYDRSSATPGTAPGPARTPEPGTSRQARLKWG